VSNHNRLTVATQRVFQQPRQLAVSVVYILTARLVTYNSLAFALLYMMAPKRLSQLIYSLHFASNNVLKLSHHILLNLIIITIIK